VTIIKHRINGLAHVAVGTVHAQVGHQVSFLGLFVLVLDVDVQSRGFDFRPDLSQLQGLEFHQRIPFDDLLVGHPQGCFRPSAHDGVQTAALIAQVGLGNAQLGLDVGQRHGGLKSIQPGGHAQFVTHLHDVHQFGLIGQLGLDSLDLFGGLDDAEIGGHGVFSRRVFHGRHLQILLFHSQSHRSGGTQDLHGIYLPVQVQASPQKSLGGYVLGRGYERSETPSPLLEPGRTSVRRREPAVASPPEGGVQGKARVPSP